MKAERVKSENCLRNQSKRTHFRLERGTIMGLHTLKNILVFSVIEGDTIENC